jgi:hypothetical protein
VQHWESIWLIPVAPSRIACSLVAWKKQGTFNIVFDPLPAAYPLNIKRSDIEVGMDDITMWIITLDIIMLHAGLNYI